MISLNGSIQFDEIFLVVLNFVGVRFGGLTIFKQRPWSKIPGECHCVKLPNRKIAKFPYCLIIKSSNRKFENC